MINGLRTYTNDELKILPYKNEIEKHYNYILTQASAGYLSTYIDINPLRNFVVIKHIQELFPDALFTHTSISDSKNTTGYITYKVSWMKNKRYTEPYPFKTSNGMRALRF